MTPPASESEICLRHLLRAGPRRSREVLAEMAKQQFTPKQVRRAREQQGVIVERAGNGINMHSTWCLPGATGDVASGVGDAPCTNNQPTMRQHKVGMTEHEHRRHQARVAAFEGLGIDAHTALQLASALVARDSHGQRASGSCAECQCVQLRICPTTPRPVIEIHECWYRRQCTP